MWEIRPTDKKHQQTNERIGWALYKLSWFLTTHIMIDVYLRLLINNYFREKSSFFFSLPLLFEKCLSYDRNLMNSVTVVESDMCNELQQTVIYAYSHWCDASVNDCLKVNQHEKKHYHTLSVGGAAWNEATKPHKGQNRFFFHFISSDSFCVWVCVCVRREPKQNT